jgi:hypothetical protein
MISVISKLILGTAVLVMAWLFALIAIRYPDNHGAGPLAFRWLFFVILVGAGACLTKKNGSAFASLTIALVGLLSTWIVDYYNIMVGYDVWIERGMPTWGQSAIDGAQKNEGLHE